MDFVKMNTMLSEKNWISLCDMIKNSCTPKTTEDCAGVAEAKENVNFICKILDVTAKELLDNEDIQVVNLSTQCFMALRNMSAFSPEIQKYIGLESAAFDISERMFTWLQKSDVSKNSHLKKCFMTFLQFFGNNTVQNAMTQDLVWKRFSEQILSCLSLDSELSNITAMILYNIILGDADRVLEKLSYILTALEAHSTNDMPYTEIIYEHYISDWDTQLSKIYNELSTSVKLLILEITKNMMQEEHNFSETYLKFLATEFKMKSDKILKTVSSYADHLEPEEVVSLLNVIASATSLELYNEHFKQDKSLFINCSYLLRAMHSKGKENENEFTSIQRLADLAPGRTDVEIEAHVAYGFKGQLIRVIGNLMYKNPVNKNLIREINCIEVLLDCCNMDARNPLIMQWVILAIRHLCEDCPENQAIILQMRKEGPAYVNLCEKAGIVG